MKGPELRCSCGSTYQPTADVRLYRGRKWRCLCGREGWRQDRVGAALYRDGDAEAVLPVMAAEVECRRGEQLGLFGRTSTREGQ